MHAELPSVKAVECEQKMLVCPTCIQFCGAYFETVCVGKACDAIERVEAEQGCGCHQGVRENHKCKSSDLFMRADEHVTHMQVVKDAFKEGLARVLAVNAENICML